MPTRSLRRGSNPPARRSVGGGSIPPGRRSQGGGTPCQSRPGTAPELGAVGEDVGRSPSHITVDESSPHGGGQRNHWETDSTTSSCSRPNSSRFSQDEIRCFRRVPTPSADCEAKLETYFQTTGKLRGKLTADCWHSLPVLKGKFFQTQVLNSTCNQSSDAKQKARCKDHTQSSCSQPLAAESLTASVLDVIYPRTPPNHAGKDDQPLLAAVETCSGDLMSEPPLEESKGSRARSPSPQPCQGSGTIRPQLQPALLESTVASKPEVHSPVGSSPVLTRQTSHGHSRSGPLSAHGGANASAPARTTPTHKPGSTHSSPNAGTRGKTTCPIGSLMPFRRWLHEQYPTLQDAYASFTKDMPNCHKLTKKEWRRVLAKHYHPEPTTEEARELHRKDSDQIFDHVDFRGVGVVTVNEFVIAVEASAPVRSLEDVRRRWLASGFTSMTQVLRRLDESGTITSQRLAFEDFSKLMSSVHVTDHGEQMAVFGLVSSDPDGTSSIGELASAVATVSPALLLEDVRDRMLRKYNGNLEKAFFDFDMNRCGRINRQEFTMKAVRSLGLTEHEARKAFREIDFDVSGEVTRCEFLGAIGLSEPSHLLEDLRLKVRQRFRSIKAAFAKAFEESTTDDLDSQPQLTLTRVADMLLPLDFKEQEIRLLFLLIDRDQSGDLSIFEFVKGVRQFAPSCVLEDLRAMCCFRYKQVRDAFASTEDRFKPLDLDAFGKALKDLGLLDTSSVPEGNNGIRVADVFNIVDVRHEGKVSIDRLVAALQSCGSGGTVWLPQEELDLRAKQDVRGDMAPVHRLIKEFKDQVRQGAKWGDDGKNKHSWDQFAAHDMEAFQTYPLGMKSFLKSGLTAMRTKGMNSTFSRPQRSKAWGEDSGPGLGKSKSEASLGAVANMGGVGDEGGVFDLEGNEGEAAVQSILDGGNPAAPVIKTSEKLSAKRDAAHIPRIGARKSELLKPSTQAAGMAQHAWGNVWKSLHTSPGHQQRVKLERHVQFYFQTATFSLARDAPLLQGDSFSRAATHQTAIAHREALRPSRSRSCS